MTEETVFSPPPVDPVVPPVNPLPQEVVDFIGVGKKYANEVEALKSVPHAQKHISSLEAELATAKAELDKRKTAQELLDEIKASTTTTTPTTVVNGLDQKSVQQLIAQTLENSEIQKKEQSNIKKVTDSFKEKFGEKAEEVYISIAKESGLSIQNLNTLAASSPSAVLKLAGFDSKTMASKLNSDVNTEGLPKPTNTDVSSHVKTGATSRDLVNAWKNAGVKVGRTY